MPFTYDAAPAWDDKTDTLVRGASGGFFSLTIGGPSIPVRSYAGVQLDSITSSDSGMVGRFVVDNDTADNGYVCFGGDRNAPSAGVGIWIPVQSVESRRAWAVIQEANATMTAALAAAQDAQRAAETAQARVEQLAASAGGQLVQVDPSTGDVTFLAAGIENARVLSARNAAARSDLQRVVTVDGVGYPKGPQSATERGADAWTGYKLIWVESPGHDAAALFQHPGYDAGRGDTVAAVRTDEDVRAVIADMDATWTTYDAVTGKRSPKPGTTGGLDAEGARTVVRNMFGDQLVYNDVTKTVTIVVPGTSTTGGSTGGTTGGGTGGTTGGGTGGTTGGSTGGSSGTTPTWPAGAYIGEDFTSITDKTRAEVVALQTRLGLRQITIPASDNGSASVVGGALRLDGAGGPIGVKIDARESGAAVPYKRLRIVLKSLTVPGSSANFGMAVRSADASSRGDYAEAFVTSTEIKAAVLDQWVQTAAASGGVHTGVFPMTVDLIAGKAPAGDTGGDVFTARQVASDGSTVMHNGWPVESVIRSATITDDGFISFGVGTGVVAEISKLFVIKEA